MSTLTPNIGLQIPATGSNNWYIPLNYNFNRLDLLLGGQIQIPSLSVENLTVSNFALNAADVTNALGYIPLNPANVNTFSALQTFTGGLTVSGTEALTAPYSLQSIIDAADGSPASVRIQTSNVTLTADDGVLIASNFEVSGNTQFDLSVTCQSTLTLAADPTQPLQAATKQYVDAHAGGGGVANVTITLPTTTIAANSATAVQTVSMPGLTTSMAFSIAFGANPSAVTGWGTTGGLVLALWCETNGTLSWSVINQTGVAITPGAMSVIVGAK